MPAGNIGPFRAKPCYNIGWAATNSTSFNAFAVASPLAVLSKMHQAALAENARRAPWEWTSGPKQ